MKKYLFYCVALAICVSSCTKEITTVMPVYVDSIAITNKINEVVVGQTHPFGATHTPWEAERPDNYTWHSSDNAIATIDANGLMTAIEEGAVTITLNAEVPQKKGTIIFSDTVNVTVHPIAIEGIRLNRNEWTGLNGSVFTLTVSYVPENAKPAVIEWISNNPSVATVSDNGIVTTRSAGNATITAQVKGTNIKAECWVYVNPVVITAINFEETYYKLEVGFTTATKLIITPDSAENKNVTYTSSDPSIATVSSNGVITGVSNGTTGSLGKGPGRATITATSAVGGLRANCIVDVYSVPDLVTVTVNTLNLVTLTTGSSGTIIPTLHNNSSKPIYVKRFRLMDAFDNFSVSIIIETTLEAYSSYLIDQEVVFISVTNPRAEFTYDFEGGTDFKSSLEIRR